MEGKWFEQLKKKNLNKEVASPKLEKEERKLL